MPFRIVPDDIKGVENFTQSSILESADVLGEDEFGPEFFDDSVHLEPQPRPLPGKAPAESGAADVLAREAARDEPCTGPEASKFLSADRSYVPKADGAGEVLLVDVDCIEVDFAEICVCDRDASEVECETEAADAAEQVKVVHHDLCRRAEEYSKYSSE